MTRSPDGPPGSEERRIALVREALQTQAPRGPGYVGIGDDAAVVPWPYPDVVVTVDAQVEGTHFRRDWCSLEDVGYRSLMAAASDIAAMGGSPKAVTSALVLPKTFSDDELRELVRGQRLAADALGCDVIGGNFARGDAISVTTTVLGAATRVLLRSGAKVGDHVFIGGNVGLARAGLLSFERGLDAPALAPARTAFRRPHALISLGIVASQGSVTACMDLSDGLAEDAPRLASASDVSLWFESALLFEQARTESGGLEAAARALSEDMLSLLLQGGEDYALLATGPDVPSGFTRVGEVRAAHEKGRVFVDDAPLELRGFSHFDSA